MAVCLSPGLMQVYSLLLFPPTADFDPFLPLLPTLALGLLPVIFFFLLPVVLVVPDILFFAASSLCSGPSMDPPEPICLYDCHASYLPTLLSTTRCSS